MLYPSSATLLRCSCFGSNHAFAPHLSPLTSHPSPLAPHLSPLTPHPSPLTLTPQTYSNPSPSRKPNPNRIPIPIPNRIPNPNLKSNPTRAPKPTPTPHPNLLQAYLDAARRISYPTDLLNLTSSRSIQVARHPLMPSPKPRTPTRSPNLQRLANAPSTRNHRP